MKLNHLIPQRRRRQVIRQIGGAKLLRQSNGQHELIGGTPADRQAALEWVSLFAHEIVFSHFYREAGSGTRPCRGSIFPTGGAPAFRRL
jgi:hypothetical protein